MSVRSDIVDALEAALNASAGKPTGLTVHRSRALPIDADTCPATVLYLLREPKLAAVAKRSGLVTNKLTVRLEHRVTGPIDAVLDSALEPLLVWGTQRLCADPLLGGRTLEIHEVDCTWVNDVPAADRAYGAAAQDFEITYATLAADPMLDPTTR